MKVAVLISGYLRTFELNINNLKNLLSNFDTVDIFLHITNDESSQDKYMNNNSDLSFINELNPKIVINEDNLNYSDDKAKNNLFNLWSKYYKLNEIKKVYEDSFGKYDLVIKYRPDMNILSMPDFEKNDYVYIPSDSKIDINKLNKLDDEYICDIFSYGSSEMMDKYFDIFESIEILSNKYGNISETLLYHHLNDNNINYKLIDVDYNMLLSKCNVFAIAGDSGSGKTTLGNILKQYFNNSFMFECDRYHKWERGDDNWKKYTHLNPEANYITKMNSDIFDLKIGKTIYHVDYDHKVGKFTDKQEISTSDNIIVCGLHSLYNKSEHIYNLKIFIDTDYELKKKWKIERDCQKRGYTVDSIITQIESRKEDYYKFIYPQREKSDVIINFFEEEEELKLKLYVSKKYNLEHIINNLYKENVIYDINYDNEKFTELLFSKYIKINIPNIDFGNFYDYIVFILLKLDENNK
jgi:uridine kinase